MSNTVAIRELSSGDAQVYYRGKPLYASPPRDSAVRRVARLRLQPDTLILWSSPLLWYGVNDLLQSMPAGCRVVGVEQDADLFDITRRSLPVSDTRVSVIDGSALSIDRMLSTVGSSRLRRVVELTTNSAAMLHRKEYRTVAELLERQIRITWQNRRTLQAMSRLWIHNIQRNLPLLPFASTPQIPSHKSVVVCGAGPSLERSIDFIDERRENVTLVAVDTALPILHARGLVPDLVVALEGQLYNAYDFLPVATRDYGLCSDLTASPHVVELHESVAWTISEFDSTSFVKRVASLPGISTVLPPLGSVGVAAVDLAQRWTSGRVFLTGLDFAVQPGKTHARGAPSYQFAMARSGRLAPVRDRGVEVRLHSASGAECAVGTTQVLLGYARDLERIADSQRCFVIEPSGVALALPTVTIEQACTLTPDSNTTIQMQAPNETVVAERANRIYDFVSSEINLLERLLNTLSPTELPPSLPECDYVITDTGMLDTRHPGPSLAASIRINAEYYLSHWERTAATLAELC